MLVELKVPVLPESVSEGTLGAWHKQAGDSVSQDELIVELETDKVVLEIVATASGVLASVDKEEGATVTANEVLGTIDTEAAASGGKAAETDSSGEADSGDSKAGPAARKLMKQHGLDAADIEGTVPRGRSPSRMSNVISRPSRSRPHPRPSLPRRNLPPRHKQPRLPPVWR